MGPGRGRDPPRRGEARRQAASWRRQQPPAPHPSLPSSPATIPSPALARWRPRRRWRGRPRGSRRTTRSGCCSRAAHQPARRARRGLTPSELTRALPPPARLRSRHHRHEPHPQALLPLGRRPPRPGAGARPGPGVRRLRRHRRRPAPRSAPGPASPTSRPPPTSGDCWSARASGSHPRRGAARGRGVGVGRNGGNAKARRRRPSRG